MMFVAMPLFAALVTTVDLDAMWRKLHTASSLTGDLSTIPPPASLAELRRSVDAVKNTTECNIRLLAYELALTQLPDRAKHTKMIDVFDALELSSQCNLDRPTGSTPVPPSDGANPTGTSVYFVSAGGDDTAAGTEAKPFKTIAAALAATRKTSGGGKAIVLRKGTHYLGAESIKLTAAQDSGLTLTNYAGEEAWISGGVVLPTEWKAVPRSATPNVWVTDVPKSLLAVNDGTFDGLFTLASHQRLTRARYPNANPEDRFSVKNLGGRDGLLSYVAPAVKPKAPTQVWINLTVPTTSKSGKTIAVYNYSGSTAYKGYANGVCDKAGDPTCPCGTWKDVKDGKWSSYSYHCGGQGPGIIGGGWENMDSGDGYYNGPVLPLGLRYDATTNTTLNARASKWTDPVGDGGLIVAWRAQGTYVRRRE